MTDSPLDYRVLSLGRGVAAAYALRLLGDLGARCSRWGWTDERPGDWPNGERFSRYFARGVDSWRESASRQEILGRLEALVPYFDLLITDFSATEVAEGELERRLLPFQPALVVANVDHFGRVGPYSEWIGDELTDYALGGYWALAGAPGEAPLRVPGYQAQFHAGLQLTIGALAALRYARRTGRGQELECTSVEAMLGAHWSTTVAWTHEGRVLKRTGSDLFRAKDGWVFFYRMGIYPNLFLLIGQPDLMEDDRWNSITGWLANSEQLWRMVEEWCRGESVEDIVNVAQELRIPVTPMATAPSLLSDPVLRERGFFEEDGGIRYPGMPYRWSAQWDRQAPSVELRALLSSATTAEPVGAPTPITSFGPVNSDGALAGIRVLELTNNWAGPIAGRHLGDLGAEVIKVELASKSATRASHYPGKEPGKYHWNRSGYFNEMNRNKRDVALNLATEQGKELFLELVAQSDVVIENNSARVMPNLGLGYEQLSAVNPRLIMASISGFGATGARRDWVAFGSNIEAACGLAAMTGYGDSIPYRTGSFVADPIAGGHAVVGVLAALERRDRTGHGAHLDISLTESALPFMLLGFTHFQDNGAPWKPSGNCELFDAPTGAYRCAGADDWIAIAVRTDAQWEALADLAGIDVDLGRSRELRLANRHPIDGQLSGWTVQLAQYECARRLQAEGVPSAPILHNWQLHCDPHLFAREAFVPIEHPDTGVLPYPGFPWRLRRTPAAVRMAAPRFAEANQYVFRLLLGRTQDEIADLYASGVTADAPTGLVPVVV